MVEEIMNNNDRLIRLRYALDIKENDMIEMFKLGGIQVTKEEVEKMLVNPDKFEEDEEVDPDSYIIVDNTVLISFLNGLITFKRGKKDSGKNDSLKAEEPLKNSLSINNEMLKKVKIALSLTSDDLLDIFYDVDVDISKSELSALLRKEGHRNYKVCLDRYARNFLKGLALHFRD